MFTCKSKRGLKWGVTHRQIGYVDFKRKNPNNGVAIRTSSWGNSSKVGFTVTFEWGKSHQRSLVLSKDLKWGYTHRQIGFRVGKILAAEWRSGMDLAEGNYLEFICL